jgi:hypothetical protein
LPPATATSTFWHVWKPSAPCRRAPPNRAFRPWKAPSACDLLKQIMANDRAVRDVTEPWHGQIERAMSAH